MFPFAAPKFIQPALFDQAYLDVESIVPLVVEAVIAPVNKRKRANKNNPDKIRRETNLLKFFFSVPNIFCSSILAFYKKFGKGGFIHKKTNTPHTGGLFVFLVAIAERSSNLF